MTDTMQQVQLVEWGGPEVLHLAEVPVPEPVRGHVVVRVQAAGVNPIDTTTRKGLGPAAQLADTSKPVVLGWDIAGVVTAVAGDYTGFAVGDRVFGMVNFPVLGNAYAQYALVPAYQLAYAPDNVPMEQLGAAPLAALTAYQALFEVARLAAGERILIHAGAGGVGHMAIQLPGRRCTPPHLRGTVNLWSPWVRCVLTTPRRIFVRLLPTMVSILMWC